MDNREKLRSLKQRRDRRLLTQLAREEDSPNRESTGRHNPTTTSSPARTSSISPQMSTSDGNPILERS